jgi:hypothetical protein
MTCLNELKREAHTGFSEEEVETLIDALINIEFLGKLFCYCSLQEMCRVKQFLFLISSDFLTLRQTLSSVRHGWLLLMAIPYPRDF